MLLGLILLGQANEFAYSYLGNGRLFSLPAVLLCAVSLVVGLQCNPRPTFSLPFYLLIGVIIYSTIVACLVDAASAIPQTLLSGIARSTPPVFVLASIYIGIQAVARTGGLRKLAVWFTCAAIPITMFQIGAYVLGHEPSVRNADEYQPEYRFSGIFGDPNEAACASVILFCLATLAFRSAAWRILIAILSLGGVLVTFSRGGLVAYIAVLAVNGCLEGRRSRVVFMLLFAISAAFVLYGIPWISEISFVDPRAARHLMDLHYLVVGQAGFHDNSRGRLLDQSLVAMAAQPTFGYGFSGYMVVLGNGPHNMFAQFGLLAGVPAAVAYGGAVLSLLVAGASRRDAAERRFVVSTATWLLVMGLSSQTLLDDKHCLLLTVLACVVCASARRACHMRAGDEC